MLRDVSARRKAYGIWAAGPTPWAGPVAAGLPRKTDQPCAKTGELYAMQATGTTPRASAVQGLASPGDAVGPVRVAREGSRLAPGMRESYSGGRPDGEESPGRCEGSLGCCGRSLGRCEGRVGRDERSLGRDEGRVGPAEARLGCADPSSWVAGGDIRGATRVAWVATRHAWVATRFAWVAPTQDLGRRKG